VATHTQVSLSEFLRTSFDGPDREYVDGEILERSMPKYSHASTQWRLSYLFGKLAESQPAFGATEQRVQTKDDRVRVIDLAVWAGAPPEEEVPSHHPLIAIEILSPGDPAAELLEKLHEYAGWGVPHIWVVHPAARTLMIYRDRALQETDRLDAPELSASLSATDVFGDPS